MKRAFVLGIIVGLGCLTLVVAGFQAPSPAALSAAKIEKLKDNLYGWRVRNVGKTKIPSFEEGSPRRSIKM